LSKPLVGGDSVLGGDCVSEVEAVPEVAELVEDIWVDETDVGWISVGSAEKVGPSVDAVDGPPSTLHPAKKMRKMRASGTSFRMDGRIVRLGGNNSLLLTLMAV
jgi:hypothetical protein